MPAHNLAGRPAAVAEHRWDSAQFCVIFAVAFLPFLAAAVIARFVPARHGAAGRSVFAEAWEAAGTTAQLAFAG